MRGADFERYLERLDEEISLAIFTPLLMLRSGDKGSLNLGVQHAKTFYTSLNALGFDLKEYIDAYICERIKKFNFTENAPRCEWVPRRLGRDNDETIRAIVTALITQGHAKPNIDEIGVALGLSMEKIKQVLPPGGPNVARQGPNGDQRDRSGRPDRGSLAADGPSNTLGGATPRAVRG